MDSFYNFGGRRETVIDSRDGIGPHHLAIGKTRKLFAHGAFIYAFFSTGFDIKCVVADRTSRAPVARSRVPVNVAFGGAQFCIDDDGAGGVALIFVERGRDLVGVIRGRVSGDHIEWAVPQTVFRAPVPGFAAPWIAFGARGELWAAVVARDPANARVGFCSNKDWRSVPLFDTAASAWHPSCVQMLPIGAGRAIALGFRGTFPVKTELVAREFDSNLRGAEASTVAPCNVNDQLTFHFQAIGDAERGQAHVAYLDDGLATSAAHYKSGVWQVERCIFKQPSFAPQLTLGSNGGLALLVCDYEGQIWRASRSAGGAWSATEPLSGTEPVTISPAFGRTSYGTGGLISAARSDDGDAVYLAGLLDPRGDAPSRLVLGAAFADGAARFAAPGASAELHGNQLNLRVSLEGLTLVDLKAMAPAWQVRLTSSKGEIVSTVQLSTRGLTAAAWHTDAQGAMIQVAEGVMVTATERNAFDGGLGAATLAWELALPANRKFDIETVTARAFRGVKAGASDLVDGALVDIWPYAPEANAIVARDPSQLPRVFRRLI